MRRQLQRFWFLALQTVTETHNLLAEVFAGCRNGTFPFCPVQPAQAWGLDLPFERPQPQRWLGSPPEGQFFAGNGCLLGGDGLLPGAEGKPPQDSGSELLWRGVALETAQNEGTCAVSAFPRGMGQRGARRSAAAGRGARGRAGERSVVPPSSDAEGMAGGVGVGGMKPRGFSSEAGHVSLQGRVLNYGFHFLEKI